ncbi:MAG: deoxyguanosinetriphosphate triphosphohydrolase [Actinomycetaceae bacterium]|nr:deoxyguanosinetriphosphate triphosphohydrolase [Actinomycetaceae bacterium]
MCGFGSLFAGQCSKTLVRHVVYCATSGRVVGVENRYRDSDTERFAQESAKSPTRTDFERDRGRLLHCSALRRMGAKTQVVGPESDDFIRTRLTHSLEVAQVGRSLAKNLGADPDIVETACLAHDLGHPPYGHNGERALNEVAASFGGFEGNAQTLRVLTRLEPKRFHPDGSPAGLNLTRATLDATIKYPWTRFNGPKGTRSSKFGAYDDDRPAFEWAHENNGFTRPAEAQMMDLADDIAYSVHDIEDAIVRHSFQPMQGGFSDAELTEVISSTQEWYGTAYSVDELASAAHRLTDMRRWPGGYSGTLRDMAGLKDYTSDLIGRFISAVTEATRAQNNGKPLVRYAGNVVVPRETLAEIVFLKGVAVHYVMAPRENDASYYEQRSIIFDLVDAFTEAPEERLERTFIHAWKEAGNDEDAQMRVIVDQIASLTDQSARVWHARYCGMLRH